MLYQVEKEYRVVVDMTRFNRFYNYWHKWIEDHIEDLSAREFLLAGSILTAMDDFSDFLMKDANQVLPDEDTDDHNDENA